MKAIILIIGSVALFNPAVTPGNVQSTICKAGYTSTIRPPVSYTNALKIKQLKGDKFADKNPKHYEEDHILSLELGGNATNEANLIPEAYENIIGKINLGARQKDVVETYLHREVCAGRLSLREAQYVIVNDWQKIYKSIQKKKIDQSVSDD